MSWHLWLYKKLFKPPVPEVIEVDKIVYKIIDVKGPRIAVKWDKEIKAAVATLQSHPGFLAILDRLALQKAMLETKNNGEFHKELREVDHLQSGIFWLGFVQQLIHKASEMPLPGPRDAMAEELEAFRELDAKIERVGMD